MTALSVAVVGCWIALRGGSSNPVVAGAVAWGAVAAPIPTTAVAAVVVAARRWRRAAAITRESRRADADTLLLADLIALGVGAGRTVRGALVAACPHVHPGLRIEIDELLAAMDRDGSAPALVGAAGRLTDIGRVVAAAVTSGAPVGTAVTAHADRLRHARHTERITAARRLPVRLLLPLALLILPGFVVLAVGPAVLQALARLAPIP